MHFLSSDHLAAATVSLQQDEAVVARSAHASMALNYVVIDGPDGDFSYHIAVVDGLPVVARGEIDGADATMRSTYETAARVSRGETTSQAAVATRKIRVRGSVGTIMRNMTLLAKIEAAINDVSVEY